MVVETDKGMKRLKAAPQYVEKARGHITYVWKAEDEVLKMACRGQAEFDGRVNYNYSIVPKQDLNVKDIRLELPVRNESARYFMGIGLPGQDTPEKYDGKWDAPVKAMDNHGISIPTSKKQNWLWPFDSFWIGNTKVGVHCELQGTTYSGPLLNVYRPAYPESWYNEGKGGFRIERLEKETVVTVYSGQRQMVKGKQMDFKFALLMTPVKSLDTYGQFTNRYYHNGPYPEPTKQDIKDGVSIINVHHANPLNPYINYPLLNTDTQKAFTQRMHAQNCKVKIYYTLREMSNAMSEIGAIKKSGNRSVAWR